MADESDGSGDRGSSVEFVVAILLGIGAILTAYAAYNGALAGGDALKGYTQSSRTTSDANAYYAEYSQTYDADAALFLQYQLLVEKGDTDTAQVIKDNLFSDRLTTATDAWLALPEGEGPATPLATEEYVVEDYDTAQQLTQQAEDEFNEAQRIDDQGDKFDLAAVYLAISLFFAGMAALFKIRRNQLILLAISGLAVVPGLYAIGQGKGWI